MQKTPESHSLVSVDDPVWDRLENYYGLGPISPKLRAHFTRDIDLLRLANGKQSKADVDGLLERVQDLRDELTASQRAFPNSGFSQSGEIPAKANLVGILAGLVYRYAEIEEQPLTDLVGQILTVFSPRFDRGDETLESFFHELRSDENLRVAKPGAYRPLMQALDKIRNQELSASPDPFLATATRELWQMLSRLACDPLQPVRARRAALAACPPDELLEVYDEQDAQYSVYPISKPGGLLHGIKAACSFLAAKYHWTESGALHFIAIVAGCALVKLCQVDIEMRQDLPCLTRIRLSLDPLLAPDEVRRIYAEARSKILPHHKEVSEAHMYLAGRVFTQTYRPVDPRHPGCQDGYWQHHYYDWKDRVRLRPDDFPQKLLNFESVARFRRAAEQAQRRLLRPKFRLLEGPATYYPSLAVFRRQRGKGTVPL